MAYQWDFCARHLAKRGTVNKQIVEVANNHNEIVYMEKIMPSARIRDRAVLMRLVWKKLDEETSIMTIGPAQHPDFPAGMNGTVRLEYTSVVKATQDSNGFTSIEFLLQIEDGGRSESVKTVGKHLYGVYKRRLIRYGLIRTIQMQEYVRAKRAH